MFILILGIILFLGAHTLTTLRPQRAQVIDQLGAGLYRKVHIAVSIIGIIFIAWGFHRYRAHGLIVLWHPPALFHALAVVLMWVAVISFASMGKTPSQIRGWVKHPMLTGLTIWAFAHILANGDLGGLLLFIAFLAYAIYDRMAVTKRGDEGAPKYDEGLTLTDRRILVFGTVLFMLLALLHPAFIGVPVLG